jgi:hypothetical protein
LNPQQFNYIISYVLGHLLPRFLKNAAITFAGIYIMAQQADMQKRLEYMNQIVQNSSLNAQCILGNNKRELQNIFIPADQDSSSFICTQGTWPRNQRPRGRRHAPPSKMAETYTTNQCSKGTILLLNSGLAWA